jgi:DNA polymerase III subunit epsilon
MYLFFDTETTGLPKNWKAPVTDTKNWPRITQLAWQVYDDTGKLVRERCELIKPDGWTIPDEKFFRDNNMSTERCEKEGVDLLPLLKSFIEQAGSADYLIAHNMSFDEKIIECEMVRAKLEYIDKPNKLCTMKESTDYCKIYKWGKYKWPTLSELHVKLFKEDFDGAHDALADVKACAKSFFELKKRKVMLKS